MHTDDRSRQYDFALDKMKSGYWRTQMLAGSLLDAIREDLDQAKVFFGANAAASGDLTKLSSVISARALLELKPDVINQIIADTTAFMENADKSDMSEGDGWAVAHLQGVGESPESAYTHRIHENWVASGINPPGETEDLDIASLRRFAQIIVDTANEDIPRSEA